LTDFDKIWHADESQPSGLHLITGGAVASASPVLTAISLVNSNLSFSTTHRIDIPKPIAKKFGTGDYVHDCYSSANLVEIRS